MHIHFSQNRRKIYQKWKRFSLQWAAVCVYVRMRMRICNYVWIQWEKDIRDCYLANTLRKHLHSHSWEYPSKNVMLPLDRANSALWIIYLFVFHFVIHSRSPTHRDTFVLEFPFVRFNYNTATYIVCLQKENVSIKRWNTIKRR